MPKKGPKGAPAVSDPRKQYALLCEQSTRIFAEPCKDCMTDVDYETMTKVADPKKTFQFALVGEISSDGTIKGSSLFATTVRDLSIQKPKTLNFDFGQNRVS